MTEPVLVVHGVNNHIPQGFITQVAELERKLESQWRLIPAFWGDLGGKATDVEETLPGMVAGVRGAEAGIDPLLVETMLGGSGAVAAPATIRGTADPQGAIFNGIDQATAATGTRGGEEIEAVRQAVREELPTTRYLRRIRNRAVLEAVGRALAAVSTGTVPEGNLGPYSGAAVAVRGAGTPASPYPATTRPVETRWVGERVADASETLLHRLDEVVGTVVGETLGQANLGLRQVASVPFINFFGDVFAYQRNGAAIRGRLWEAIEQSAPGYGSKEKPINVIAHSLGGVVSFDAALDQQKPLWIKAFLTFGSQASFFHVVDPRRPPLADYCRGAAVALPETIGSWTNL
jgi:hypothetical protein